MEKIMTGRVYQISRKVYNDFRYRTIDGFKLGKIGDFQRTIASYAKVYPQTYVWFPVTLKRPNKTVYVVIYTVDRRTYNLYYQDSEPKRKYGYRVCFNGDENGKITYKEKEYSYDFE